MISNKFVKLEKNKIMKKNIINRIFGGLLFLLTLGGVGGGLLSCSDQFLADKRPYGSYGPEQVYYDESSIKLRLNYIYQKSLPYYKGFSNTSDNYYPDLWPIGGNDYLSAHTEEFTGYGTLQEPGKVWDNTNIAKFFFYGINESPWKKIRECTDVIVRVYDTEGSQLSQSQKDEAAAQAKFFRATRYFRLWKRFGGLPIVNTIQSTLSSDSTSQKLYRTSSDSTFKFMMEDLLFAGENLPVRWDEEANNWGRITSGAAYALAGYIANYYASPVFNRQDEQDRWQYAYAINKLAMAALAAGNFGLSYDGNPGTNASNWAKIWSNMMGGETNKSEAVFLAICNNLSGDEDDQLYNCWEQQIRPKNAGGNGSLVPTSEMVDLFPMADGKRPTEAGEYTYDKKLFFLNRDPRFYRTFAFPGTEWQFLSREPVDSTKCPYASGPLYQLQNYAWFENADEYKDSVKTGYYSDNMGTSGMSIYVRKKSQDYALETSPLYNFTTENGFQINGQPCIYMRYTTALLNYAEAACGAGELEEAWNALISIRQRVGYTGNCGLDPAIKSDRAKMFEAILYERQIELAYEGVRFDDCVRWMLFDGGEGQAAINSSWAPTGWDGNTCQYLGTDALNGQLLHQLVIAFDPQVYIGEKSSSADPFIKVDPTTQKPMFTKPTALTLNEDFRTVASTTEEGEVTFNDANVKALAQFYMQNLVRKDAITMTSETAAPEPVWPTNAYFFGLGDGDQTNNPNVAQTMGWQSYYGGMGVFDPCSKNPVVEAK